MKLLRKIVSVLAALTVASCAAASSVYAVGNGTGILLESNVQYASAESFSTIEEAAAYLKEQIKLRNENVSFTVPYSVMQAPDIFEAVMEKAFAETGNGDEGDYIRFGIHGYACNYGGNASRSLFEIVFSYFTTNEQERLVDQKVESILDELDLNGKTEYEKIVSIYDYIVKNVAYAYGSSDDAIFSSYSALFNGEAVCQGFAQLFYRLASDSGISCRIISGTAAGGNHAWNIAAINGRYYLLDPTFDCSYKGERKYFFLKGSESFDEFSMTSPHIAGSGKEGSYAFAPDYTSAEFAGKYPISLTDYDPENDKIICKTGDVNGDGYVDASDATLVLRAYTLNISGKDCNLSDEQMNAADINGDKTVDASDATHILRYYTMLLSGSDYTMEQYQDLYLR